ncbi:heme-binding protein [Pseudorhodoplanes sp.]|uniref:GlcG/HbpS family heme-binding protein n=1 Tax=Pseudorhodoplanes sp. TaxID=1934341 RepID=UPI002B76F266|nr:heme-binding protein [Pseudorhodoplanes sp.]HWV55800.1 heme-binding protein [Pseudorhodoplanes sp.]
MDVTVKKSSITCFAAQRMIDGSIKRATELGKTVSIAVLDEGGWLVAFARMPGAALSTVQVATDKAYTSATTGKSTQEWFDTIQADEPLRAGAAIGTNRLIVFGGGQPICWNGDVIGAIGVSGSHWTMDTEIGAAGIAALGENF